jgi:acyl CoA:acetate/3-ketoacid CoA transferase alpha subunit
MKTIALQDAVAMIPDGASLMIGGFMAAFRSFYQVRPVLGIDWSICQPAAQSGANQ